jgi:hypothetical protein
MRFSSGSPRSTLASLMAPSRSLICCSVST